MILIILGCTIALAAIGGIAWLVHQARQDRPGRPVAARAAYQLPPEVRPRLEVHKTAIEPPREIHLHLHGIMPDQIAASVTQRGAYLKEDC